MGVGGRHPGVLTRADRQRAQAPLPLDALQPEVTTYQLELYEGLRCFHNHRNGPYFNIEGNKNNNINTWCEEHVLELVYSAGGLILKPGNFNCHSNQFQFWISFLISILICLKLLSIISAT